MVSQSNEIIGERTSSSPQKQSAAPTAIQQDSSSSTGRKTNPSGMSVIRESLQSKGIPPHTLNIIMSSWRESTQRQYGTYLQKWQNFCSRRSVDPISPTINQVLEFFTELYDNNCGYSALNSARSALSALISLPGDLSIGNHPLITRFLKGVFQIRPALPRYSSIWDVNVVLKYLKSVAPATRLSLKELSYKVTMLLLLLSGQRLQTMKLLNIRDFSYTSSSFSFQISSKVKQTRPGTHLPSLTFKAYAPDRRLCVYTYLKEYLARTEKLRGQETQLLISFQKPYKGVSTDTIGRWAKTVLSQAGIDTAIFSAHSTRAASVSAAKKKGVPLDTIMSTAGWSNAGTFKAYYDKPVQDCSSVTYGDVILS